MPYTQSVDADATSRTFISKNLMDNFHLITEGVWGPVHYYLNAFIMLIISDRVYGPKVLHILFAVFSCVPLYYFTGNEFNEKEAKFVTLIYTLSPLVFRNSFMAMAEVCYGFFVILSMYFISKGKKSDRKIKYALLAGFSITIAGGLRYEAWQLMAIFAMMLLLFKEWRMFVPFCCSALIFPIYWMVGNYIAHKDFFYGLSVAYNWNIIQTGANLNISQAEIIKRIIFFPFSWFLSLSPFISVILIIGLVEAINRIKYKRNHLVWAIPFFVMFFTFIYKAINGTLYLQHRFTITLLLLSVPYTALYFADEKILRMRNILAGTLIGLIIPFSFIWHKLPYEKMPGKPNVLKEILNYEAIPLTKDNSIEAFLNSINCLATRNDGLIIDFIDWGKTYYIALNSKISYRNVFIVDGSLSPVSCNDLSSFIDRVPNGLLLLKGFSKLDTIFKAFGKIVHIKDTDKYLLLEKKLDLSQLTLFEYSRLIKKLLKNIF